MIFRFYRNFTSAHCFVLILDKTSQASCGEVPQFQRSGGGSCASGSISSI